MKSNHAEDVLLGIRRRSPCGERGLKFGLCGAFCAIRVGRSPCGERGLKSGPGLARKFRAASLPVRGAWVEILLFRRSAARICRSPCGERGLKFQPKGVTDFVGVHVAPRAGSVG